MAYGTPIKLRGSMFFSTSTLPTDATASAIDGDFAFAQDTQIFYQRKSGTWTALGGSVKGAMGMSGLNAQLLHGVNPPDSSTFNNQSDAIYFQQNGEVWYFDFEGTQTWVDSGQNITGPAGPAGTAGAVGATGPTGPAGSRIYNGTSGPDGSTPGVVGDYFLNTTTGVLSYFSA